MSIPKMRTWKQEAKIENMNIEALLNQAADLKTALVEYAGSPGFARSLSQTLSTLSGNGNSGHDDFVEAVEALLYLRGEGGREPLLSRYLRTNRNIDPDTRLVYEGWRDRNVLGVFKVNTLQGGRMGLHNLIDEMDYKAYATAGADAIRAVPRGGYVFTRVVPMGDIWTISGMVRVFGLQDLPTVKTMAARLLKQYPALVFNNPEKLERARAVAAKQHTVFLELFGSQVVGGTGMEAIASYRNYLEACNEAAVADHPDAAHLVIPSEQLAPDESFPPEIADSDDVALFHHPLSGLSILTHYGKLEAAHRTPPSRAEDVGAEVLRDFIEDTSTPAYVLEDLAAKYPGTVNAAYRVALSLPEFTWASDGAALLRSHRTDSHWDSGLPGVSPVPPLLMDAYRDLR